MSRNRLSRRQFLTLTATTAAGTLLAACGAPTPVVVAPTEAPVEAKPTTASVAEPTKPPEVVQPTAVPPAKFKQAPMLEELVKAGKLPPVEERMPPSPVIVTPKNAVGTYGGTIACTSMAPETTSDIQQGMVAGLFRFSDDLKVATPEVCESYEFSDDAKTCTIHLREGVMWSDGSPFTADDMIFYFEDWQFNTEIAPTLATQWQPGKTPMKYTKVDDYTVKFEFAVPAPAFALIHWSGGPIEPWRCKKYLEQFHIKYNANADTEAKAKGFDDWKARFVKLANLNYGAQDVDMPILGPWKPVKMDSQRQEYERNAYYWKVDTEGNQLPYIDKVTVEYTASLEVANLKAISGEISLAGLDLLLINYPVLKGGEDAGGYKVKNFYSERGADVALALNQLHKDPVLKEIFGNVKFRQALSLGINRDEINELIFLGQGVPRQATINESASIFKQEWADNYAQYDVDQANKLLDEIGLDKKGADGIRLRPDGKPLQFQLEYLPHEGPKKEVCELVVKYWADLGLKVEANGRERSFLITRLQASEHDMSGWHVDRQLERAAYTYGSTQKLGPGGDSAITWSKPWRDWFISGGKSGQEPPQEAKDLFDAYGKWQQTVMGSPEYMEAGKKVYDLIAQNLWVIGVVGHSPQPTVIKNGLENIFPEGEDRKIWWGAANWDWLPHAPEQWYWKS